MKKNHLRTTKRLKEATKEKTKSLSTKTQQNCDQRLWIQKMIKKCNTWYSLKKELIKVLELEADINID
ncbi:22965_t:CDS:2, partial [Gigaspora margarita]